LKPTKKWDLPRKPMNKRTWLCALGAVLLVSAAPIVSGAGNSAAAQSSVKKRKSASSKKRSKPTARGQKAPTPDRIRDIQSALKREGALDGEPTGKWDGATVDAMKKYQGDHGLNPTGKIDALTLEKLGLGSETAGKGAPVPSASSAGPPAAPAR
jgi:peptidoglycan hydrolase-like protein with peptidoglycan-binding domain